MNVNLSSNCQGVGCTTAGILAEARIRLFSGPFLVSRIGDEDYSLNTIEVPNITYKDTPKGTGSCRHQDDGHGS